MTVVSIAIVLAGASGRPRKLYRFAVDRRWHRPRAFAMLLTLVRVRAVRVARPLAARRADEKERLFRGIRGRGLAGAGRRSSRRAALRRRRAIRSSACQRPLRPAHTYILDNQARDGRAGVMRFDDLRAGRRQRAAARQSRLRRARSRGARPTYRAAAGRRAGASRVVRAAAGLGPAPRRQCAAAADKLAEDQHLPRCAEISADIGRTLDERILLLAARERAGDGFVREWRPDVFPPERHRGYAFTWFTLAVVGVTSFVGMHWRKDPST